MKLIDVEEGSRLADYELYAKLEAPVTKLREKAEEYVPKLSGHKVWMINSTAQGGGVAEMMPTMISIMRQLNVNVDWVVLETQENKFFSFTKKMHNLIHGKGDPNITKEEKEVFEEVNKKNAKEFLNLLRPHDIVVIHDPQPIAMIKYLKNKKPLTFVWRCHIGLDQETDQTKAAWNFLKPYLEQYDHCIFTAPEYIPSYMKDKGSIIHPSIPPLTHKNVSISMNRIVTILVNSGLAHPHHPVATPTFEHIVRRVKPNGTSGSALEPEDIGLLYRPIITQISRWDHLKGWLPLMRAFAEVKQNIDKYTSSSVTHRRYLEQMRLVLGGPDPAYIADDPEGIEVFDELKEFYASLPESVQRDIAILELPMADAKENAKIVNALQRVSAIIAQNSIQEGFGLTVTEAMFKKVPVLGSRACGIRQQLRDGIDGRFVNNPDDHLEIAKVMNEMIKRPKTCERWGNNGEKRVIDNFLVFTQIKNWLKLLSQL
ncbi:MAG: glycosyltransferase [Bacteriovoracia bacterium]